MRIFLEFEIANTHHSERNRKRWAGFERGFSGFFSEICTTRKRDVKKKRKIPS